MPSKHPITGRRLSGAGQKQLKAARQLGPTPPRTGAVLPSSGAASTDPGDSPPPQFSIIPPPPLEDGVVAVSEWATTRVLPVCVRLAEAAVDLMRVRTVQLLCGKLGKIRDKALRAEQALLVREDRQGVRVDVLQPDAPVGDVLAVLPWAYLRLAVAIHAAAVDELFSRDRYLSIGDAIGTIGLLPPTAAIDALIEALDPKS